MLDALGTRYQRSFADQWEFVHFAEEQKPASTSQARRSVVNGIATATMPDLFNLQLLAAVSSCKSWVSSSRNRRAIRHNRCCILLGRCRTTTPWSLFGIDAAQRQQPASQSQMDIRCCWRPVCRSPHAPLRRRLSHRCVRDRSELRSGHYLQHHRHPIFQSVTSYLHGRGRYYVPFHADVLQTKSRRIQVKTSNRTANTITV